MISKLILKRLTSVPMWHSKGTQYCKEMSDYNTRIHISANNNKQIIYHPSHLQIWCCMKFSHYLHACPYYSFSDHLISPLLSRQLMNIIYKLSCNIAISPNNLNKFLVVICPKANSTANTSLTSDTIPFHSTPLDSTAF